MVRRKRFKGRLYAALTAAALLCSTVMQPLASSAATIGQQNEVRMEQEVIWADGQAQDPAEDIQEESEETEEQRLQREKEEAWEKELRRQNGEDVEEFNQWLLAQKHAEYERQFEDFLKAKQGNGKQETVSDENLTKEVSEAEAAMLARQQEEEAKDAELRAAWQAKLQEEQDKTKKEAEVKEAQWREAWEKAEQHAKELKEAEEAEKAAYREACEKLLEQEASRQDDGQEVFADEEKPDTYDWSSYFYTYAKGSSYPNVVPGEAAELEVVVQNYSEHEDATATYKWYKYDENEYDYVEIEGATGSTLTTDAINKSEQYQCRVYDEDNQYNSVTFYVSVNHFEASVKEINEESYSDTYLNVPVKVNELDKSVTLQAYVKADKTEGITYQWKYYDRQNYKYVEIEGATGSTYTVETPEEMSYYCIVTDAYGNSEELRYSLKLDNELKISGDSYENINVNPKAALTLSVGVSALDDSQLTYEWYKYYSKLDDETGATLVLENPEKTNYHCVVRDQYGSYVSKYFYVSLNNLQASTKEDEKSTGISLEVDAKDSLTLKAYVTADDMEGVSYQWYFNSTSDDNKIVDATKDALEIDSVTEQGTYYCIVKDTYNNSATLSYYVSINNELTTESDTTSKRITVNAGEGVTLTADVTAKDMEGMTYTWYDNNYNKIEGVTGATYKIDKVEKRGNYYCSAKDRYGNSISLTFYVNVENEFKVPSTSVNIKVNPGESLTLDPKVSALDMDGMTYVWSGTGVDDSNKNGTTFAIEKVERRSNYNCSITDKYGNYTYVYFYVNVDNGLTAEGEENAYENKNLWVGTEEELTIDPKITAKDMDSVTCKWYDSDGSQIEGANGTTLKVGKVSKNASYRVEVSDTYGNSCTVTYHVYVQNHMEVTSPEDKEATMAVAPNAKAELKVQVTADDMEGMTYTWYKDWDEIESATGNTYMSEAVVKPTNYQCEVTDKYGNSQTVYFYLSVENHLTVEGEETTRAVKPKSKETLKVSVAADDKTGMKIQWYDGYTTIQGADKEEYVTEEIVGRHNYRCVVSDQYGNSKTAQFDISVENHFDATSTLSGTNYVEPDTDVNLVIDLTADDTDGVTYRWTANWNTISEAKESTYHVGKLSKNTDYSCTVSDKYGNSKTIYFYMYVENGFSVSAAGNTKRYVAVGTEEILEVVATATDKTDMTYQWYDNSNGRIIEGANGSSFKTPKLEQYGSYRCSVRDRYGNGNTIYFYVYIENHFTVVGENTNRSVKAGSDETLKVNVTADEMEGMTYRWYANGSLVEEAKGNTLQTGKLQKNSSYTCEVKDKYGNYESVSFNVGIENHFMVTGENTSRSVEDGAKETLKVNVSADEMDGVTYRWTKNGETISGAKGDSLETGALSKNVSYTCRVQDKYGNSKSIYFSVSIKNDLTVTGENATRTVKAGSKESLKVNVSAKNMEGVTYKWYKAKINNNNNGLYYYYSYEATSCKKDTFDLGEINGLTRCYCDVTDRYGNSKTVYFTLSVDNGFTVTAPSQNIAVAAGEKATLALDIKANDKENLEIVWFKSKKKVYSDGSYDYNYVLDKDASGESYVTEPINEMNKYGCRVTDKFGNSRSFEFTVSVENHFRAEATSQKNLYVKPGKTVDLEVKATADDMTGTTYQWYKPEKYYNSDGSFYTSSVKVEGATTSKLTTDPMEFSGNYYCIVTDKYGTTISVYYYVNLSNFLQVNRLTPYSNQWTDGKTITLKVEARADNMEGLTYRWSKDVSGYDADGNYQSKTTDLNNDTNTFVVKACEESARYYCRVTDQYGNTKSMDFWISVPGALVINSVSDVYSYKVAKGGKTKLEVKANKSDVTYRWKKSGNVPDGDGGYNYFNEFIENATTATLETDPVDYRATYTCIAQDKDGNVATTSFQVGIENHLKLGMQANDYGSYQENKNVKAGDALTLNPGATADDMTDARFVWERMDYYLNEFGYRTSNYTYLDNDMDKAYQTEAIKQYTGYEFDAYDRYGNNVYGYYYVSVGEAPTLTQTASKSGSINSSGFYMISAAKDEEVTLSVSATGEGLSYQWWEEYNDPDTKMNVTWALSGENGESLKIKGTDSEKRYFCRVTDKALNQSVCYFWVTPGSVQKRGDINDDTKVNRADRIYLARALANWDGYVVPSATVADFTNDGKVNRADRIYLARALAGWDGYNVE